MLKFILIILYSPVVLISLYVLFYILIGSFSHDNIFCKEGYLGDCIIGYSLLPLSFSIYSLFVALLFKRIPKVKLVLLANFIFLVSSWLMMAYGTRYPIDTSGIMTGAGIVFFALIFVTILNLIFSSLLLFILQRGTIPNKVEQLNVVNQRNNLKKYILPAFVIICLIFFAYFVYSQFFLRGM